MAYHEDDVYNIGFGSRLVADEMEWVWCTRDFSDHAFLGGFGVKGALITD